MRRTLIPFLLLLVLSACTPIPDLTESPLPVPLLTPAAISSTPEVVLTLPQAPNEVMGAIVGRLSTQTTSWGNREITVYACPFTPNEDGTGGFFILEPSIHPRAVMAPNGSFKIPDVPAGAYVIVAGPTAEDALAYRETDQPAVVEVTPGQVLELGDIEVR